jgi:hypothetical protein
MTNPISPQNDSKEVFFRYFTDSDFAQLSDHFFHDPELSAEDFWEDEEAVEAFFKLVLLAGLQAKGMIEIEAASNLLGVRMNEKFLGSLHESEFSELNEFGDSTFKDLFEGFHLGELHSFFVEKQLNWALLFLDFKNYFIRHEVKDLPLNIYSREGDKLIFLDKNGDDGEREKAKKWLKKGEIYTVDHVDVFKYSTTVYLKEFPGKGFNMVMFRNYYPAE